MEIEAVVLMIQRIRQIYNEEKRIVIITPYKNQKRHLNNKLKTEKIKNFEVNTIDAFQGDEEEIVIYCMTRSKIKTSYFSDSARLNVAFSRAKNLLIIIGSSRYLKKYGSDHVLNKVYDYIKKNGKIIDYNDFESKTFSICNHEACLDSNEEIHDEEQYSLSTDELFEEEKVIVDNNTYCVSCNALLSNNENILCFNCLDGEETCICKRCRTKYSVSKYLKYIVNEEFNQYCVDCKPIKVSCYNCSNIFEIKQKDYDKIGKRVYCPQCMSMVETACQSCGTSFKLRKHEINNFQKRGRGLYCKGCYDDIDALCDKCKNNFKMPKWMHTQNRKKQKGCLCPKCRANRKNN